MPNFLMIAKTTDRNGAPLPLAPGEAERIVLHFPGDVRGAYNFARQNNIGGNWDVREYNIWELNRDYPQPVVLTIQHVHPVAISTQHVPGGQPTGMPTGQPRQNRPPGERNELGFEPIGDAGLSAAPDSYFGPSDDFQGTITDMVDGGRHEVERQK